MSLKSIVRPLVPRHFLDRRNARLSAKDQIQNSASQSNETRILSALAQGAPRTFIEIGFHPTEFNCAHLANSPGWKGLLVDGNAGAIAASKHLPRNLRAVHAFLTLDNLDPIKAEFKKVGVLSIDIDGNDYWLLKAMIDIEPAVIAVEYNATFGLRSITVPYDPSFDRHQKHPSGWYHGASLTALANLTASHGYGLAAVSEGGLNAFFTKEGALDPKNAWRPNKLREHYSGVIYERQWETVEHMPFIEV